MHRGTKIEKGGTVQVRGPIWEEVKPAMCDPSGFGTTIVQELGRIVRDAIKSTPRTVRFLVILAAVVIAIGATTAMID
ncbi:hypothetical protein HD596_010826 [Nonomuraea jabiensis]|uniref:Uncharacterized protein n=1 Tax=Nonomuraea jabiensis TaxID=882448 RepID=A0A7W9GHR7_9ACTN|nr:hypothetical protein [Nonomuraea jabiensis]